MLCYNSENRISITEICDNLITQNKISIKKLNKKE